MRQIDRFTGFAAQFRVQARGVGNIGDQPVDALDVAAHDFHQPGARLVVLGARQHFHCALQRGQRILEFMRHVGGETLDRIDAVVERARHRRKTGGQVADFVAALFHTGDRFATGTAAAHAVGGCGERHHRTRDEARQQQRRSQHDADRHHEHF